MFKPYALSDLAGFPNSENFENIAKIDANAIENTVKIVSCMLMLT